MHTRKEKKKREREGEKMCVCVTKQDLKLPKICIQTSFSLGKSK